MDNAEWKEKIMNITIIAVGKLKEKYLKEAIAEYEKRMRAFAKLQIIEVNDEKPPDTASEKEKLQIIGKEESKIMDKITKDTYVVLLEVKGRMLSSEKLASTIQDLGTYGKSHLTFVIGGSLGTGDILKKRADLTWSFSDLTFPHQLMRVMLLEQVYRAFQINQGSPYHK